MPYLRVETAGGERVDGGAVGEADVGDDAAGVVEGGVGVDGFGEDAVAGVGDEKEDED